MNYNSQNNINDLIYKLSSKIRELGQRSFFNPPCTNEKIEELEKVTAIIVPENLKLFYLNFNGGFFVDKELDCKNASDKKEVDYLRWSSNYILSIEDILNSYLGNEGSLILCDIQWQEEKFGKKLLPFLSTSGQEALILDASDIANNTPILDAWHENCYNEWGILYNSFETFLLDYIEKDGDINTIAKSEDNKPQIKPKKKSSNKSGKSIIKRVKDWWAKQQRQAFIRVIKDEAKKKQKQKNREKPSS